MRGLSGLILFLAFNSFKCQVFNDGDCRYAFNADGSCNVAGPGGSASCFSPQFGGNCIGSVNGCQDCNKVLNNGGGSSSGSGSGSRPSGGSSSSGGKSIRSIPNSTCKRKYGCCNCKELCDSFGNCELGECVGCDPPTSGGSSSSNGSGGSKSDRNCRYECQSNGGCQVTYIGTFRPGQTQGSCFPASFGGSCSGTPRECQDCNRALNCRC